jgi:hypothetical protein
MINVTKKPSDAHKKPSKGNLVWNPWETHGEDTQHV